MARQKKTAKGYLVHLYGGVEPEVVGSPFNPDDEEQLEQAVLRRLRWDRRNSFGISEEDYGLGPQGDDSLYLLVLKPGRRPVLESFSGGFMDGCRAKIARKEDEW